MNIRPHIAQRARCTLMAASLALLACTTSSAYAGPLRDWLAERHASRNEETTRTVKDVAYGVDPAQKLDIYLPSQAKRAPVIFMVHGGAWAIGDKQHGRVIENKLRHWLPQGFALISVNYRLLPDAGPIEQAQDVARALTFTQRQATTWGLDPQRFILMGHSAGAHLIGLLAAQPALARNTGAQDWLGSILLDSAALDVVQIMETPHHYRFYDEAFGKDPNYWRQASPLHTLQADAGPMMLVCSTRRADSCAQAGVFAQALAMHQPRVTVLKQDLSHGEINSELGLASAYTQAVDQFIEGLPGLRLVSSQQTVRPDGPATVPGTRRVQPSAPQAAP